MNFVSMPLTRYSAWSSCGETSVAIRAIVANREAAAQFDSAPAATHDRRLDSKEGG
jgi:hypothetical protein